MITLTQHASQKIKELMAAENNPNIFLRVGVHHGGCSGFTYAMGFDEEMRQDDHTFEQDDIKIVVDANSYPYIKGLEIDYKESMMGGGFALHNPNAIASCGCGSSFRTREDAGQPSEC